MSEVLFSCPAFDIYKPYEGRKFKHGDVIALPFQSQRYGVMWHKFALGSIVGYAIERGECPIAELERFKENVKLYPHNGHKEYWANSMAVSIHNGPYVHERFAGFAWGDVIVFQGHKFKLEKANNQNVKLVAVD
jgi:hypothetical protein